VEMAGSVLDEENAEFARLSWTEKHEGHWGNK